MAIGTMSTVPLQRGSVIQMHRLCSAGFVRRLHDWRSHGTALPRGLGEERLLQAILYIFDLTQFQEWISDAWHFARIQLRELGLRVSLGHGGQHCPKPRGAQLEAITTTGLHTVAVDFCTCEGAYSDDDQIKAHGWWPFHANFVSALPLAFLARFPALEDSSDLDSEKGGPPSLLSLEGTPPRGLSEDADSVVSIFAPSRKSYHGWPQHSGQRWGVVNISIACGREGARRELGIENPLEVDALGNVLPQAAPRRQGIIYGPPSILVDVFRNMRASEATRGRSSSNPPPSVSGAVRRRASSSPPPRIFARKSTGGKRVRRWAEEERAEQEKAEEGIAGPSRSVREAAVTEAALPAVLADAPAVAEEEESSAESSDEELGPIPVHPVQQSLVRAAARYRLYPPFSKAGLWLTAARPREIELLKPHHVCRICCSVKCHPVTNACGHSHCFRCIHVWLQKHWYCPQCKTVMYYRPICQYAEEDALNNAYPGWMEETKVSYSWAGLKFAFDPHYPYYT
ncbi:hypothetical protein C8R43DRAFT_1139647 [Mycena crocata]|nr:hypothetical protein C8R43DRAFT_1139647 [Mycena crocata]